MISKTIGFRGFPYIFRQTHLLTASGSFPSTRARRAAAGAVRRTRDGAPGSAVDSPSATGFAAWRFKTVVDELGFGHEI